LFRLRKEIKMTNVFRRDLNDPMGPVPQMIKEKFIEVSELELTDKAAWHAYEEAYPFLLEKFVGKECNICEVGTCHGGGMKILSDIFPESTIYGVDQTFDTLKIEQDSLPNAVWIQSDQCDPALADKLPKLDFVTEDASHQLPLSLKTFEILEPLLNPGGVYVIEDVYPEFLDYYMSDPRFDIYDLRDIKDRGDDVLAVYTKPE